MSAEPEPSQVPVTASTAPASAMAEPFVSLSASGQITPPQRPGVLGNLENYELIQTLGKGGMGLVFLARDTETGQMVALKMLRPEFQGSKNVLQRFLIEARHLQKLNHPNLVPVLEARELRDGAFFVMPHFERGSLAQLLKADGHLAPARILEIGLQVAEALRFAHSKGIIHRDIKPGNILLKADGSACLADFGLARTLFNDASLDVERDQCEGTGPYMSPAVAKGEAEDTRCDIYAFGALLYEMLAGKPPFSGSSLKEIREKILADAPPPIRKLSPKADAKLAEIAEAAMARESRDRYSSMADVLEDLKRVASERAVVGPHRVWRPWRVLASHPRQLLAGATCLILLWLGLWFLLAKPKLVAITSFNSPLTSSWWRATPARWDSLHERALLVPEGKKLLAFSNKGKQLMGPWECFEPGVEEVNCSLVEDVNQDGRDEVFVNWGVGTNCNLSVINMNSHELKRFRVMGREHDSRNRNVSADTALVPIQFTQSLETTDKKRNLLAAVKTAYGGSPRAVACFDFETCKPLWWYDTGPLVVSAEAMDLDSDGLSDFVCGAAAPDNGNRAKDGTDDAHSYALAFSSYGTNLWRRELGEEFTAVWVVRADLGESKGVGLFACRHSNELADHKRSDALGQIWRLDLGSGTKLATYGAASCFLSWQVLRDPGIPETRILCSDCYGCIHVLRAANLTALGTPVRVIAGAPRRPGSHDYTDLQIIGIGRFVPGKGQQILVQSQQVRQLEIKWLGDNNEPPDPLHYEDREILVLDGELRLLARHKVAKHATAKDNWTVKAADMDGDGIEEVLSLSDHAEILKFER